LKELRKVRYFVCAVEKVSLAIPADQIERIIPAARVQTRVYETENDEAFISVPALLKQADLAAPHGLVLKSGSAGSGTKIILLTPKIDTDLEIPEESIRGLPGVFTGVFSFFSGAYFNGGPNVILILDPRKLVKANGGPLD